MPEASTIHAIAIHADGQAHTLPADQLHATTAQDALVWYDVNTEHNDTKQWLNGLAELPRVARETLLAADSRPNLAILDQGILLVLRGVNLNQGAELDDMISIRIWIDRKRVITSHRRQLQSVLTLRERVLGGEVFADSGRLLTALVGELTRRIREISTHLDQRIDDTDALLDAEKIDTLIDQYGAIRRSTIRLRRYLTPQRDALQRLTNYQGPLLSAHDQVLNAHRANTVASALEEIEMYKEYVISFQDELANDLVQAQNSRIYLLSIVAAIFLPLTFVTGLLGMNVGGIPMAQSPHGFWAIMGISVVTTVMLVLLFRSRRWI